MMRRIFFISAGDGPMECCRAVYNVSKLIMKQAEGLGLEVRLGEHETATLPRAYYSAYIELIGHVPDQIIQEWEGTIQWISKSPFRASCKRKNWFVMVKAIEAMEELHFNEADILFETFRSPGAGGQHVNKVESGVRLIHQVSGICIKVTDSRSQLENKKIAKNRFAEQLSALKQKNRIAFEKQKWQNNQSLLRGNPVKVIQTQL